jgi:bifunctional DNase/RNase
MIDPVSQSPIIVLRDASGTRSFPSGGIFEANAIAMQLEKVVSPRPMTHDLLRSAIETLRARVDRVVITDLRDNIFFAMIHLLRGEEHLASDARPSDAMALALRVNAPIFVEDAVLKKSSSDAEDESSPETERLRKWLEEVDPEELGKYEM